MTEPSDATDLTALQRDVLAALGLCLEKPGIPSVAEVRSVAYNTSNQFTEGSDGFYKGLNYLDDAGYVELGGEHPDDARTNTVGLTAAGEEALSDLAERSAEAADVEVVDRG